MTTVTINEVTTFDIPDQARELAQRKRDLDIMVDDPDMLAALYDALALDFESIGQTFPANRCRKVAAQLRKAGART